jgi:UDP-N-acetylmuramyl pentapeptide phosphotransferase/UDP-N-acetylglucosamine-1-phosphate transferase
MKVQLSILLGALMVAAFCTWAVVAGLISLAPRIGLLDRPNERSSHQRVTARGGGIGFVLSVALSFGALVVMDALGIWMGHTPGTRMPGAAYLGAALFVAAVSLQDDLRSLGAGMRMICHLSAAGIAAFAITSFLAVAVPGWGEIGLGRAMGAGLTIVWIVGLTNVYNFMDGIDGIAGVQGAAAGLAWAWAGAWMGAPTAAVLAALLAGGCLGFLVHNWSPARIFMGDVGSAFLGFSFAALPLLALTNIGSGPANPILAARLPLFSVLVVWPFIGDGLLTFVRRALKREPVWKAHRSHLYQRLVQTGWTHARVSSLYGAWCVACALVGWAWLTHAPGAAVLAVGVPLLSLGALLAFVTRRERVPSSSARTRTHGRNS